MELTEEKTREYEALKADDRRLAKEIDILMKKNNDLQSQVSRWKKKTTGKRRHIIFIPIYWLSEKNKRFINIKPKVQKGIYATDVSAFPSKYFTGILIIGGDSLSKAFSVEIGQHISKGVSQFTVI
jgi:hypothetical protein